MHMRKAKSLKLTLLTAAVALGLALILPASSALASKESPATAAASFKWGASILPATYVALGSSLPYGYDGSSVGDGMFANDIDNWYDSCSGECNYHFALFVFTNAAVAADITFKMVAPDGSVAYSYAWSSEKIPKGTEWFYANATGKFRTVGTYWAEVYGSTATIKSTLLGFIPVILDTQ
jgi:hypothetical protein